MSPRFIQFGVAGLMAASAMAAPQQYAKRDAVTKTVTELTVETVHVQAGAAPAAAAPTAHAAPAPAPAAPAAAPAVPAPAVHVAAQVAPAAPSKNDDTTSTDAVVKGGKRGLLFDSTGVLAPFDSALSNGHFSWAANWVSSPHGTLPAGLEYVPQLKTMFANVWETEASAALATGSKFLMHLNEPDIASQENMSPAAAVASWHQYMEPFADKAKLISPSVSNSESAGMGTDWLGEFLEACSDCTIHACGFHWHDPAGDFEYFKQSVEKAHEVCGDKPLWVSEASADADEATQAAFVAQAIPWLDAQPYVERYAYFMASTLETGGVLNSIGQAYADAS